MRDLSVSQLTGFDHVFVTAMLLLCMVLLTACFTAWVVLLLKKWRVTDWMQAHGGDFVYRLASCDYCMSWWLAWVIAIAMLVVSGWLWWLAVPFLSTALSRLLCA